MYVKKIKDTTSYEAPNHQKCHSLRLSGFEEYGPENFWVGHSQFLPGGGAGPDPQPRRDTGWARAQRRTRRGDLARRRGRRGDGLAVQGGAVYVQQDGRRVGVPRPLRADRFVRAL